jgi:hypothetical protein
MRYPANRTLFREALETIKDANAVLPFKHRIFIEEFFARVRAIGETLVQENGWTDRELAEMRTHPSLILDIELGEDSLAAFEEFKEWFGENGHVSFHA